MAIAGARYLQARVIIFPFAGAAVNDDGVPHNFNFNTASSLLCTGKEAKLSDCVLSPGSP